MRCVPGGSRTDNPWMSHSASKRQFRAQRLGVQGLVVDMINKFPCSRVLRAQTPCSPVTLCRDLRIVFNISNYNFSNYSPHHIANLLRELKEVVSGFPRAGSHWQIGSQDYVSRYFTTNHTIQAVYMYINLFQAAILISVSQILACFTRLAFLLH